MINPNRIKFLLALLAILFVPATVLAANISQAYQADKAIPAGSIVSLNPKNTGYVQPANTSNASQLLGVAVPKGESLLAVDADKGKVQVATSGTVSVLVSTVNGEIRAGDQVAVSPFNGIGMKAEPGSHVIGLAQTALDLTAATTTTQTVTDKNGKQQDIKVGQVRISIAVTVNNLGVGSAKLNPLQQFAHNLTGRTVSTARIVLSMLIAVVALITLATLIYGSIYGSIISVGRNPLAKHAILRMLTGVVGMVVITALTATLMIAALLR